MAIIPKSQRRVTELSNIPSSALRKDVATPAQFGSEIDQVAQQIGPQIEQAGLQALQKNKITKRKALIRDSVNEFNTFSREYNSSVYDKKAQDAIDIYPEAQKTYEDTKDKMVAEFGNPIEKEIFLSNINSSVNNSLGNILKHQESQISAYEDVTLDAQNQNFIDNAIQNRFEPDYIKQQEEGLVANTRFKNDKYGLEGKVAKQNVDMAINNFNVKVLESFDSPSKSNEYLKDNWNKFSPAVRTELQEKINKEMEEIFIREKSLELSTSGLTLEQQLQQVDKIKDPKQASAVRRNVKTRNNEKEAIRKSEQKQFEEQEWDKLFENPLIYNIPIKQIDSTTQKQMLNFKNKAINEYKQANGVGVADSTDYILYNELMSMSDKEFLEVNLNDHISKLNATDFKSLVNNQRNLRRKDNEAFRVRTYQQQAKSKIQGMKEFDARKGKEKKINNVNHYYEQFNKSLESIPENERTEERVGKLIDGLLSPVSVERFGIIPDKTYFRFEVPYLESIKKQKEILGENIPQNLQKMSNVKFDERQSKYYVDYDNIREIYNTFGELESRWTKND